MQSSAAQALQSERRWIVSGTPVNNPSEVVGFTVVGLAVGLAV